MMIRSIFILLLISLFGCQKAPEDGTRRIAILTPITHQSLEEIENGFREAFENEKVVFKTFNAGGNRTLMRSEVEKIARSGFDLVLTIGAQSTKITKEVFEKNKLKTPVVYAAVTNPDGLGLSSPQLTGSVEVVDYPGLFHRLRNHGFQTLLLVYDPSQWMLETYKMEIERLAKQDLISIIPIPVFQTNMVRTLVVSRISQADAVLVLKDNTVVTAINLLAKLALEANVPLIASDLDSFEKGADIAYGVKEREYGRQSALLAKQILYQEKSPGDLSPVAVDAFEYLEKDK